MQYVRQITGRDMLRCFVGFFAAEALKCRDFKITSSQISAFCKDTYKLDNYIWQPNYTCKESSSCRREECCRPKTCKALDSLYRDHEDSNGNKRFEDDGIGCAKTGTNLIDSNEVFGELRSKFHLGVTGEQAFNLGQMRTRCCEVAGHCNKLTSKAAQSEICRDAGMTNHHWIKKKACARALCTYRECCVPNSCRGVPLVKCDKETDRFFGGLPYNAGDVVKDVCCRPARSFALGQAGLGAWLFFVFVS